MILYMVANKGNYQNERERKARMKMKKILVLG